MRFASVKHLVLGLACSNCSINGNFPSFHSELTMSRMMLDPVLGIVVNIRDVVSMEIGYQGRGIKVLGGPP